MKHQRSWRFWTAIRNQVFGRCSDAEARAFCYALGPISGALCLRLRPHQWTVLFHAFYSMLMSGIWALSWGTLHLAEALSPWFLGALFRELRFAVNLGFALIWVLLLINAYLGNRCAVIPLAHELAVRLARRYERHERRALAA